MPIRSNLIPALLALSVSCSNGQVSAIRETELRVGPFGMIPDTELGAPVNFENEIDVHPCFPLIRYGDTVAWIHRAHSFSGTVLVLRCVELDPTIRQTPGNRHGAVNTSWSAVRVGPNPDSIQFEEVTPRGFGVVANPSFCGQFIAYWATDNRVLLASVYDAATRQMAESTSLGESQLETDDEAFLPRPEWTERCEAASFDATRAGKGQTTIRLEN